MPDELDPVNPVDPVAAPEVAPEAAAVAAAVAAPDTAAALASMRSAIECFAASLPGELLPFVQNIAQHTAAEALGTSATDLAQLQGRLAELQAAFDNPATSAVEGVGTLIARVAELANGLEVVAGKVAELDGIPAAVVDLGERVASLETRADGTDTKTADLEDRVAVLEARPAGGGVVDLSTVNSTLALHTEQIGGLSQAIGQAANDASEAKAAVGAAVESAHSAQLLAAAAMEKANAAADCCATSVKTNDVVNALAGFTCDSLLGAFRGQAASVINQAYPLP